MFISQNSGFQLSPIQLRTLSMRKLFFVAKRALTASGRHPGIRFDAAVNWLTCGSCNAQSTSCSSRCNRRLLPRMYPGSTGTNSHRWSQTSLKDRHSPCLGPASNFKKLPWNKRDVHMWTHAHMYTITLWNFREYYGRCWECLEGWNPRIVVAEMIGTLWCPVPIKVTNRTHTFCPSFIGTLVAGSLMAPNHTNPGAPSLMSTPKHLGGSTSRHVGNTSTAKRCTKCLNHWFVAAAWNHTDMQTGFNYSIVCMPWLKGARDETTERWRKNR